MANNSTMFNIGDIVLRLLSVSLCLVVVCRAERDVFSLQTLESHDDYVDPHSFYYDKHKQKEVLPTYPQQSGKYIGVDKGNKDNRCTCDEELRLCKISLRNRPTLTDVADELLSRRLVNTLLSRAKFKKHDELFSGHLELQAMDFELEALRKFGNGHLTLREIDPIINRIMKKAEHDRIYESAIWIYDMYSWMYSWASYSLRCALDYKEIVASVIFTLYVIHALRRMRYNLWMVLSLGTISIFIMSFFITWWKLIQEAEISHSTLQMKHMHLPIHCQPEKMSWWDKLTTWFSSTDDCRKYHEAMMRTPFLQVTPAQALSHMFSHVIYEPLTLSGKALSQFLQHVTADMSPFTGGIVRIVICVTFLPGLMCCLFLIAGGSMTVGGFGPLSFFSLKGPKQTKKRRNKSLESKSQRNQVEILLNITTNGQPMVGDGILEPPRSVRSNKLALKDKSPKNETREKKEAVTSKSITKEASASGDCKLSNDNSDSDNEIVAKEVKRDVIEPREVGSGDRALE